MTNPTTEGPAGGPSPEARVELLLIEARVAGRAEADAEWREKLRRLAEQLSAAATLVSRVCEAAQEPEFGDGYSKCAGELLTALREMGVEP
jgi:hypothetical protein